MTKRELIDEIQHINRSARGEFLAKFDEVELGDYLRHLQQASSPRPRGSKETYERYFSAPPRSASRPRSQGQASLEAIVHRAWQVERSAIAGGAANEAVPCQPADAWEQVDTPALSMQDEMDVLTPAAMDDGENFPVDEQVLFRPQDNEF